MSKRKPFRFANTEQPSEESQESSEDSNLVNQISKFKDLPSIFGLGIGLAYTAGFLITNIYLNTKYGIYDFSLIKARYIYTGVMFLVLCLMAAFGSFLLLNALNFEGKKTFGAKLGTLLYAGFTYITSSSMSSLAVKGLLVSVEGGRMEAMYEFPITPWFWFAIPVFAFNIWFLKNGGPRKYGIPMPISSSVITSTIVLAAFYGITYHQFLPLSLGGGMPSPIKIVAKEESKDLLQQIVPFESGNITDTIYLIDQSDKSYFVLIENPQTNKAFPAEIDKSLVVGLIHPNEVPVPRIINGYP